MMVRRQQLVVVCFVALLGSHTAEVDDLPNWDDTCLWKDQECCTCSDCCLGYKGLLHKLGATQSLTHLEELDKYRLDVQ
jgi:hypothetical protein